MYIDNVFYKCKECAITGVKIENDYEGTDFYIEIFLNGTESVFSMKYSFIYTHDKNLNDAQMLTKVKFKIKDIPCGLICARRVLEDGYYPRFHDKHVLIDFGCIKDIIGEKNRKYVGNECVWVYCETEDNPIFKIDEPLDATDFLESMFETFNSQHLGYSRLNHEFKGIFKEYHKQGMDVVFDIADKKGRDMAYHVYALYKNRFK